MGHDEHGRVPVAATRPPTLPRLAAATLLTAAVALVLNATVYLGARAFLDLPTGIGVLTPGAVVIATLAGTALGAAGLAVLSQHAARPVAAFRRLALLVGGLSLLGPLAALAGLVAQGPGVSGSTFVTLAAMNLVTTAVIILVLPPTAAVTD
jgi:hypothetical protein